MLFGLPLRTIPFYNSVALIVINFTVFVLMLTVVNHTKLKETQSKVFFLMSVFMLLWVDFAYLARLLGLNRPLADYLLKVAWFATPLLFYFTYLESIFVIKKENSHRKLSTFLLFGTIIFSILSVFTNIILKDLKFTQNTLDIVYGVGFYPYLVWVFILIIFTVIPILRLSKEHDKKATYFLSGITIFYFANLIFNITLPVVFRITHLYYFGDYSTIFLLGFTTFSIVRYKFMDIKVFSTEAFTLLIWIILFTKLFVTQTKGELAIDLVVFILMVVFGVMLIRSVIKEIKQKEKLEILTKKLKQLDAQKDEFVSVAAHELRAPMTAIKGFLSLIKEGDAGEVSAKVMEFITDASEGNDRLIRLVNNMLNIGRIEENRMVYQMDYVHLKKVIDDTVNIYYEEAKRKNLKLEVVAADNITDLVYVDKDRINEVISNLLSNSIKYTEQGSVTIKLTMEGDFVKCEIIDTGRGISREEQEKLFKKFQRTKSSEGKTLGSGLGL